MDAGKPKLKTNTVLLLQTLVFGLSLSLSRLPALEHHYIRIAKTTTTSVSIISFTLSFLLITSQIPNLPSPFPYQKFSHKFPRFNIHLFYFLLFFQYSKFLNTQRPKNLFFSNFASKIFHRSELKFVRTSMALSASDLPAMYSLLANSMSGDESVRKPAESALSQSESRPGFCSCLMVLASQSSISRVLMRFLFCSAPVAIQLNACQFEFVKTCFEMRSQS